MQILKNKEAAKEISKDELVANMPEPMEMTKTEVHQRASSLFGKISKAISIEIYETSIENHGISELINLTALMY